MTINVVGIVWAGYEATYSYHVGGDTIPDAAAVKRLAGDFRIVADYRVTDRKSRTEVSPGGYRTITDVVTLREWETPEAAETFEGAQ